MSIAEEAGIKNIKGIDATTLNDETIKEAALNYNIFGRVTPKQKKQIIKVLKENGKTVAMTGDGINDVLALKEADCSIAMASGTDGARNVSQLVLLNSDFSSIPHIVAEGRRIINNIERSASLLLVKTIFTILLVLLCIILGSKYFFIPIQLTLITTFTIGIPSFILALEPNTDIVKGNFLVKVIGKSVPAALTVVFNVIIVEMFKYALKMNSDINHWDVSHVTNMQEVFFGAKSFNRPLDKWDTSNVVNMTQMFALAEKFNQDINQWNVSNVRYMSGMFYKAKKFDQMLDKWDVSKVEYMADMFAYTKYNRPLYKWNIASLLDPCGMFEYSTNDKYIEGSLEYYFKDIVFQYKVYYRLKSIGRGCRLYYNHRTDPWRDPEESKYYPYFKDDHDVYLRD